MVDRVVWHGVRTVFLAGSFTVMVVSHLLGRHDHRRDEPPPRRPTPRRGCRRPGRRPW